MCLCGSQKKQRLFFYTALNDWLYNWVFTICSPVVNIYSTVKHYIILHSVRCVFMCLCGSQNKLRLFFYTALNDWFYSWDFTICSPVVTIYTTVKLYIILHSVRAGYLCVLCGSKDKVRLFFYTTLNDWFYN
jgi:hypothetical protein